MSCYTSAYILGQLLVIHTVSACWCSLSCVLSCISYVDMHSGLSVHISFWIDAQHHAKNFLVLDFTVGLVLIANLLCEVMDQTCMWCTCCIVFFIVGCIEITVIVLLLHLFWIWLQIVCGQWLCWLNKQNNSYGIFLIHVICWLPLCWCSAPNRLVLTNAMGHNIILSGVSSHGQFILSLYHSGPAPKPTPGASASKNSGSISL